MRMKQIIIFFIILIITTVGILAAILLMFRDGNEPQVTVTPREPTNTINQTIGEAVTIYASSSYHEYSGDELRKYFISEIADDILRIYEPVNDPNEEMPLEFEEQPLPEIKPIWIIREDSQYAVKLQFGEVFYNYCVTITPNHIITKIIDGGITFE